MITNIRINAYGAILSFSILVAYLVARKFSGRFGLTAKQVDDVLPWIVICGLIGARIYFVAFSWDYFGNHIVEIPQIWKGGIAIYGGILGSIAGIALYALKNKLAFWSLTGLAALAAPLGQAIGRWGNYFNQEAFGRPTDLPWGIDIDPANRPEGYLDFERFHPTFLYESLWNLAAFTIMLILLQKFTSGRYFAGLYMIMYGMGRFMIEWIRLDSFFIGNYRVDQVVSILIILAGIVIIFFRNERKILEYN